MSQPSKPVVDGGDKQDNKNSQHHRSVETLGLSGSGINNLEQLARFVEKCLTVQARLVIGSKDLRSPNKYEVLPIIMEAVSTFSSAREQEAERKVEKRIAEAIWEEEQKANKVLQKGNSKSPGYGHLLGRIVGLQRARDIAEGCRRQLSQSGKGEKS